jgi:peptide chain release factor 3
MAIEQERGISVTTSVMKFTYRDYEINLLDTPGHQDFSEDTYRVLTAVDSALMVIDSAKGVEAQTEKLMEVCRMRNTPIITFINKLDREGLEPLDLLAEIEDKLQIECTPALLADRHGQGLQGRLQHLPQGSFNSSPPARTPATKGQHRIKDLTTPGSTALLGRQADDLREDLELLAGAANPFRVRTVPQGLARPRSFSAAPSTTSGCGAARRLRRMAPPPARAPP